MDRNPDVIIMENVEEMVRLVRACGSKPFCDAQSFPAYIGQARKSLWIETPASCGTKITDQSVRLVRACGSKPTLRLVNHICPRVRLVRACGSKHGYAHDDGYGQLGQARKSLWIETRYSRIP